MFSLISDNFSVITQPVVVISYRRFGTTYRAHPQGFKNPFDKKYFVSLNVT